MLKTILNKNNQPQRIFSVQRSLCNSLHGTSPLLPKHPDFTHRRDSHPFENTRHAKLGSCCGTEGRGFKPRRSPQLTY
jgi:hypothetical protein